MSRRGHGGSGGKESRFILMPKSNRLLHGIRDGITSYQRICTLHRCNPNSCCSTNYATVAQCRPEGREQSTLGVTRELRVHPTILPNPLARQESRGMRRRTTDAISTCFLPISRPSLFDKSCCSNPLVAYFLIVIEIVRVDDRTFEYRRATPIYYRVPEDRPLFVQRLPIVAQANDCPSRYGKLGKAKIRKARRAVPP